MTEQEWLEGHAFYWMLGHLKENALTSARGRRRLRRFEYACLRLVWDLLDDDFRTWADLIERCAEKEMLQRDLNPFLADANSRLAVTASNDAETEARGAVVRALEGGGTKWRAWYVATGAGNALIRLRRIKAGEQVELTGFTGFTRIEQNARDRQLADLLREVLGNPFRPPAKRKWPADVRGLAQACYDDQSHYPLLADALADLGEDEAAEHCRLPGPHVRGCWALDLILGKE
jgi:hypothetical protein